MSCAGWSGLNPICDSSRPCSQGICKFRWTATPAERLVIFGICSLMMSRLARWNSSADCRLRTPPTAFWPPGLQRPCFRTTPRLVDYPLFLLRPPEGTDTVGLTWALSETADARRASHRCAPRSLRLRSRGAKSKGVAPVEEDKPAIDWVICVDWAKSLERRRAWVADVAARSVGPLACADLTLGELLKAAPGGRGLIGIDAVLGVPRPYSTKACTAVHAWQDAEDFPSWLSLAVREPRVFEEVTDPEAWSWNRPFIAVPPGAGTLTAFRARAGSDLLRSVDKFTSAKPVFVVSGFSGTVGAGTRDLWRTLAPLLPQRRIFGVWPFEGSLPALLDRYDVVLRRSTRASRCWFSPETCRRRCFALQRHKENRAPRRSRRLSPRVG